MKKSKMRRVIIVSMIVALFLCTVPAVFAASYNYVATFPMYKDHTTIVSGTKSSQYTVRAMNEITGPSESTCGYFWIDPTPGSNQITSTTYCEYGVNWIDYDEGLSITGTMYLRGQAGSWALRTHEVSGKINFG